MGPTGRLLPDCCSLCDNNLGDEGGVALGEALKVNSTLTVLSE